MAATATSVRLSEDTAAKLDRLVAITGRSRSYYLREAIESSIDRLVWEYSILDDVRAWRAGQLETVSLDQIAHDCDLDG